jgi:hypothetical protein
LEDFYEEEVSMKTPIKTAAFAFAIFVLLVSCLNSDDEQDNLKSSSSSGGLPIML